jgi:catechol 2,3-dioxygenase-like lactoylglutathione lyase family enzyme
MIIEHIGLNVSDFERSFDFYTNVLGFSLLRKSAEKAYIYLGNDMLELKQSPACEPFEWPDTPAAWRRHMYDPVGIGHIGFRVDDLDAMVQQIRSRGGDVVTPPYSFMPEATADDLPDDDKLRRAAAPGDKPDWKIAVVADPDGIMLEFIER